MDVDSSPKMMFNPLAGGALTEVREGLSEHRAQDCPLTPTGIPGVEFVSRYDDVRQVLLDHDHLSNHGNFILDAGDGDPPPALITQSDPPEHTALRDLLRPGFRRASMANAAPWIAECVTELVDRLPDGGPSDVVGDIAMPLTATVISRLIGVPQDDAAELARLSLAITEIIPGNFLASDTWTELEGYFVEQARRRRAATDKPDDLLTRLVTGSIAGKPLEDREVAFHAWQLFVAGLESTAYTIGWTVYQLLVSRDRWEALLDDRSLLPLVREEGLRHCTAIRWVMRSAEKGTEVGAASVAPDLRVLVGLESANLDEAEFGADAAKFDMRRESARKHVSFGHGIHLCLGAELSRIEITTTLNHLLDRMPGLRLADHTYREVTSPVFCGPRRVDVVW